MVRQNSEEIRRGYQEALSNANPGDTIIINGRRLLVHASAGGGKHTTFAPALPEAEVIQFPEQKTA